MFTDYAYICCIKCLAVPHLQALKLKGVAKRFLMIVPGIMYAT
jgi:hypothetical protein